MSTLQISGSTYFKFSPTAASQTQGYILISEATLQSNLYAAGQGTATLWLDSALTQPYLIPGSGSPVGTPTTTNTFNPSANNEWGNIFTTLFTGFTAGYWGTTAQQSNSFDRGTTNNLGGGSINLDNSINWSPSYAFDVNRIGTIPTYQHNDAYTQAFFNNSNFYGSAFSDNLSNGLSPTPLISVWDTAAAANVSNIDLYVYGSGRNRPVLQATGRRELPAGADGPGLPGPYTDLGPGRGPAAAARRRTGRRGCRRWRHAADRHLPGQWAVRVCHASLPAETSGRTTRSPARRAPGRSPRAAPTRWARCRSTICRPRQPRPQDRSTGTRSSCRTARATSRSMTSTPPRPRRRARCRPSATSVAADGGATFPQGTLASSFIQLNLNAASTLPSGMLAFFYDSQQSAMPAAPVAGTAVLRLASPPSTPRTAPASPSTMWAAGCSEHHDRRRRAVIAFGWTGTNNGTHSGAPTNPTFSGSTVTANGLTFRPTPTSSLPATRRHGDHLRQRRHRRSSAAARARPTWTANGLTSADPQQLGNGTYPVSMQEYLSDGTTIFGSSVGVNAPVSAVLGLNVSLTQLALQATPEGDALAFAPHGDLPNGAGNWLHFNPVAGTQLTQGAQLLLYATMADGTLVGRDGKIGAGVSISDATLARLGSMRSDGGIELLKLGQTLFLPDDQQLHFALLNADGTVTNRPDVHITPQSNGSMLVTGAGLSFSVTVGNTLDHQDYFASDQRSSNLPVIYLNQGETIHVEVAGGAWNANTIHFVRFDYDREPRDGRLERGRRGLRQHRRLPRGGTGEQLGSGLRRPDRRAGRLPGGQPGLVGRRQEQGFYAPVLVNSGRRDLRARHRQRRRPACTSSTLRRERLRLRGSCAPTNGGDFDYNDMVVKLSVL